MATYNGDMANTLGLDGTENSTWVGTKSLAEALGLQGLSNWLIEIVGIAETLGFTDTLRLYIYEYLEDVIGLSDSPAAVNAIVRDVIDTIGLNDTGTSTLTILMPASDNLGLDDITSATGIFDNLLAESMGLGVQFDFGDGLYTGWVTNMKSFASTQYLGYNFNSVGMFKGRYFGARQDGIYLMEGSDDAGTAIDACIKTGVMDFTTLNQKRVPKMYLGMKSDGKLVLKTITDENVERHYELLSSDDNFTDKRIQMHRGVRSRYWQFEITNKDGADFELDRVDYLPIILTRRTGGKK